MEQNIDNYAVYYGYDEAERLGEYDLVIVEPSGQDEKSLSFLKENNTLVIAYVSILEISEEYPEFKYLKDEDFITINGKRIVNSEFNNYLVNLNSKRYVSMLIHKIGDLILNKGYQGIFLDTVGDIEFEVIPEFIRKELIDELVKLLEIIKGMFPKCIIIQNNGTSIIKYTIEYVDILMLENPDNNALKLSNDKGALANYIIDLKKTYDVKLFLLFEKDKISIYKSLLNEISSLYSNKDVLFYLSEKSYLDL